MLRWGPKRDWVVIFFLVAQPLLLLASGLLGSGLSMQAAVSAARATEARAEQAGISTNALAKQAEDRLARLEDRANSLRGQANAELAGEGPTGRPGAGPLVLRLATEADAAVAAAQDQRELTASLAAEATREVTRARLAAEAQERVANISVYAGISVAVLGVGALGWAEVARTRRAVTTTAAELRWRRSVVTRLNRRPTTGTRMSFIRRVDHSLSELRQEQAAVRLRLDEMSRSQRPPPWWKRRRLAR